MKKNILWRILFIGFTILVAVIFFLPNTPAFKFMPEWWTKNMPNKGIILGLDLQGGLHLVFEVEGDKAVETSTDRYANLIKDMLAKKKIQADVKRNGLEIQISAPTQQIASAVKESFPLLDASVSGQNIVLKIDDKEVKKIKDNAVDQALETIRNRVDQFGVAEPTIIRQGDNEIVVQLPGVKDPRRAIELVGKTALLEFKIVDDETPIAAQLPQAVAPGDEEKVLQQFATNKDFARPAPAIEFHRAKRNGQRRLNGQGTPEHQDGERHQHQDQHQGRAAHGDTRQQQQSAKELKPGQDCGHRVQQQRTLHQIVLPHQLQELDRVERLVQAQIKKSRAQQPPCQQGKQLCGGTIAG